MYNINCTKCRVSFLYEMSCFVFVRNVLFRFCTKCLVSLLYEMSGFGFVRNVWFWFLYEMSCVRTVVPPPLIDIDEHPTFLFDDTSPCKRFDVQAYLQVVASSITDYATRPPSTERRLPLTPIQWKFPPPHLNVARQASSKTYKQDTPTEHWDSLRLNHFCNNIVVLGSNESV